MVNYGLRTPDIGNTKPRRSSGGSFDAPQPPKPTGGGSGGQGFSGGGGGGGGGGGLGPLPTTTTPPASTTNPVDPFSGGGGGYGGGYGGGGDFGGAPVIPSEEDFLAGDKTYQLQMNALKAALETYLADNTAQRSKYDVDYNTALDQLGFTPGVDDPATENVNEALTTGEWDWRDPLTASGRAYGNQLNDFAARGMLQSSAYGNAFDELVRTLGQQNTALSDARTTFLDDLARQEAAKKNENTLAEQAARQEAIARRAAQYGIL